MQEEVRAMRRHAFLLATGVCVCLLGTARAESLKDPAAVLPARLVGYVEVRQPGALAREVASLFEGSMLGDVPDSLARFGAEAGPEARRQAVGVGAVGLIFSPEVFRELGRLDGVAFAV